MGNKAQIALEALTANAAPPIGALTGSVRLQAFFYTIAVDSLRAKRTQSKSRFCNSDLNMEIAPTLHETRPTFGRETLRSRFGFYGEN
jgi:hypothetical protein